VTERRSGPLVRVEAGQVIGALRRALCRRAGPAVMGGFGGWQQGTQMRRKGPDAKASGPLR